MCACLCNVCVFVSRVCVMCACLCHVFVSCVCVMCVFVSRVCVMCAPPHPTSPVVSPPSASFSVSVCPSSREQRSAASTDDDNDDDDDHHDDDGDDDDHGDGDDDDVFERMAKERVAECTRLNVDEECKVCHGWVDGWMGGMGE